MRWIRHNPLDASAFGAIALGVVMLVWVLLPKVFPDGANRSIEPDPSLASPYSSIDGEPIPDPKTAPTTGQKDNATDVEAQTSNGLAAGLSSFGAGGKSLPGLSGRGGTSGLPRHSLTLTMTSAAPIGGVGYIIPTSLDDDYGIKRNVPRSFSITTAVYGDPAYAQGFAQAGARGYPITCTITVDGVVTDRRSTDGPYGQLYCVG